MVTSTVYVWDNKRTTRQLDEDALTEIKELEAQEGVKLTVLDIDEKPSILFPKGIKGYIIAKGTFLLLRTCEMNVCDVTVEETYGCTLISIIPA